MNGVGSAFWLRRPIKRKSGRGVCGSKVTGSFSLKEGLKNFLKMVTGRDVYLLFFLLFALEVCFVAVEIVLSVKG